MTPVSASLLREIIELIMAAQTLSPEKKEELLSRLERDGLGEELRQELVTMCSSESVALERQIAESIRAKENLQREIEEEEKRNASKQEALLTEHEASLKEAVGNFRRACDEEESAFAKQIEREEEQGSEEEVANIKAMLQNKEGK